ncbi:MAG: hypothetical protein WA101_01400 [Minisyncoccia bacterium]
MKEQIKKMFDETFSNHFENASAYERNFNFLKVLDYLFEVARIINNKEELFCYSKEWDKVKWKIVYLSIPSKEHTYRLEKVDEINTYILLLKADNSLLEKQDGSSKFFEERYKKLFNDSLIKRKDSKVIGVLHS